MHIPCQQRIAILALFKSIGALQGNATLSVFMKDFSFGPWFGVLEDTRGG